MSEAPAADDYLWFLQERMESGEWVQIDQADDEEGADELLSRAENCFSGLEYRLQRSDWQSDDSIEA